METKINIAEILKDKPQGIKLYADAFGELSIEEICTEDELGITLLDKEGDELYFYNDGKYNTHGEPILVPSKSMRDWRKFAWEKGDILLSKDNDVYIIFEKFEDDAYTKFKGKHYLWKKFDEEDYSKEESQMLTSLFEKVNDYEVQTYINAIEERLGGKLNRETLEIEKAQHEFKDGDIITFKDRIIIIYNTSIEKSPTRTGIYYHACLKEGKLTVNEYLISCGFGEGWYSSTEEEKHQLFDALAKEGKAWDAEKKQIVDLKSKIDELKPFDKVLVRANGYDPWQVSLFGYKDGNCYYCCGFGWSQCIPYIGNESLLGTTDNFE